MFDCGQIIGLKMYVKGNVTQQQILGFTSSGIAYHPIEEISDKFLDKYVLLSFLLFYSPKLMTT